jgi:transcriptional regulator with XRE-family HTH domain
VQAQEVDVSPLGETLRRARLERGITFEDAERVTRIPRKYLEALETENYGILPAPVFARGFLRSYSGYLGLDPGELLPFFPVGHVEEPTLENLPEVSEPRTWNLSSVIAMAVVGGLILLVIALYSFGADDGGSSVLDDSTAPSGANGDVITPEDGGGVAPVAGVAMPELKGQSLETAISLITPTGASYLVVGVRRGDAVVNQVVEQSIAAGETVGVGDTVTIYVQR